MSTKYKMDSVTTREAFGRAMFRVAQQNEMVAAISADTPKSLGFGQMMKAYPARAINCGIAEQNMMAMAAGMAAEGYLTFAASYGTFTCMRALEQFRTFIAYPNLNVKVAGGMAGLSGGVEGVTHQSVEDIGIMRAIPNCVVAVPADAASTEVITEELAKHSGPAYIRLGRGKSASVFDETYRFEIGKANLLGDGGDVTLICCGSTVRRCIDAREQLAARGIHARLLEMPCIKPLDEEAVLRAARETGAIVTAEENSIIGGLGGAVAELLGEKCPTRMKRCGVPDVFAESGELDDLMDVYGLSVADIAAAAEALVQEKREVAAC